jgi:hypothetical protein
VLALAVTKLPEGAPISLTAGNGKCEVSTWRPIGIMNHPPLQDGDKLD